MSVHGIDPDVWRQIVADFGRLSPNLSPTWLRETLALAAPGLPTERVLLGLTRGYDRLAETARATRTNPQAGIDNWSAFGRKRVLDALREVAHDD